MRYRSTLQPAPHLHEGASTSGMMWTVTACLLPAGIWGVLVFGMHALLVIVTAVVSSVVGELAGNLLMRRFTLHDGSAVLSGLLIGYLLPSGAPLYVPVAASLFAMLIIKAAFGGLGSNWINPAVGGQLFVYLSWGGALASWSAPRFWPSGTSGVPSPLEFAAHRLGGLSVGSSPAQLMHSYPVSGFAQSISQWLSQTLQLGLDPHMIDLFSGSVPGFIGAVSPLFLLLGSLALFARRIVAWQAPVGLLGSFFLLTWIFGGLGAHQGWFGGFPFFGLFSGGILFAGLFLCTDPVTSPLSRGGLLVFGVGIGTLAFVLRLLGVGEEAVLIALLVMNVATPGIDKLTDWEARRSA